jgi:hypothetical protein
VLDDQAEIVRAIDRGILRAPLSAISFDLAGSGYVEEEWFASGIAHSFEAVSMPSDGRWTIEQATSAGYRTRILTRLPSDPAHFNGTVVVEWMNVSSGESAPDWDYLNPMLMREGFGYVAVSAQRIAISGGPPLIGSSFEGSATGLANTDPDRYGSLHHPGDEYSFDLFAQIGQSVAANSGGVTGILSPDHVVATGESQSAYFLTTFANAVQPIGSPFDGIFLHSRGGSVAPLDGGPIDDDDADCVQIRDDIDVPVFVFETQTDLIELRYSRARQENTDHIRTWEVAGTAHADAYLVGPAVRFLGCTSPVNDGPQHEVIQAAFTAFNEWVVTKKVPPCPEPLAIDRTTDAALVLDEHGNALGGVRTPAVDVPTSILSGSAPEGASEICSLFGETTIFTPMTLARIYGSKAGYLTRFSSSLDAAIDGGYILAADRSSLLARARSVEFPD